MITVSRLLCAISHSGNILIYCVTNSDFRKEMYLMLTRKNKGYTAGSQHTSSRASCWSSTFHKLHFRLSEYSKSEILLNRLLKKNAAKYKFQLDGYTILRIGNHMFIFTLQTRRLNDTFKIHYLFWQWHSTYSITV